MKKVKIEYSDFNNFGGITQYAITVKGESLQSIERTFYNKNPTAWDAIFTEVAA